MSDDFIVLSYMTGTLRGVECAGQAVAYGIKSSDTTDWISIGLNVGLSTWEIILFIKYFNTGTVVLSLPFAWVTIRKIGVQGFEKINFSDNQPDEKAKAKGSEEGSITPDSKSLS